MDMLDTSLVIEKFNAKININEHIIETISDPNMILILECVNNEIRTLADQIGIKLTEEVDSIVDMPNAIEMTEYHSDIDDDNYHAVNKDDE